MDIQCRHIRRVLLNHGSRLARHPLFLLTMLGLATANVSAAPTDFDTTFGGGKGYVHPCLGDPATECFQNATRMTVLGDGRIVLVGSVSTPPVGSGTDGQDWVVVRFDASGNLDTTFAGTGWVSLALGGGNPEQGNPHNSGAYDAVVRPDGSILGAGWALDPSLAFHNTWLVSLNADGSYDTGFAQDGKQVVAYGEFSQATAMAMLPNGTPIIGGEEFVTTTPGDFYRQMFVLRSWVHGGIDPRFGATGFRLPGTATQGQPVSMTLQGNCVLVVYYDYNDEHDKILKLNLNDGQLVPEFGSGGIVDLDFAIGSQDSPHLLPLPNGKIAGSFEGHTGYIFRLNSDGSLDTSFNGQGWLAVGYDLGDIAWVPTGQILAIAEAGTDSINLARYTADGQLDPTFFDAHGNTGILPVNYLGTGLPPGPIDLRGAHLAIQPDGRIVFDGSTMVTRLLGEPLQLQPNAFSFVPRNGVPLNTTEVSGTVTIHGLTPNALVPISVTGGELVGGPGSGYVRNGDTIAVTHQSASTSGTSVTTTVRVGGLPGPSESPWDVRGGQVVATFTTTTR